MVENERITGEQETYICKQENALQAYNLIDESISYAETLSLPKRGSSQSVTRADSFAVLRVKSRWNESACAMHGNACGVTRAAALLREAMQWAEPHWRRT